MTLTQAAILTKQFLLVFIILSVTGIGGFIGYNLWHAHYLSTLPAVEEKPDTTFGLLPNPDFPVSNVSSSNFTYALDTTTGSLPKLGQTIDFPKIIKVYFVTRPYASLLSSERSQELAAKFAITTPPEILSDTEYKFVQDQKVLEVNLDSGNFLYTNVASPSAEDLDEDNQLTEGFVNRLNSLGVFKPDLQEGRKTAKPLDQDLNLIQNRSEAKAARISVWMKDIDGKQILTDQFDTSLINATVFNSSQNLENYQSLQFIYWPIDTTISATYPLKDPQSAFDDLKSGKGVIIAEPSNPNVSITSVYLAYFLSKEYSPYLQPIYVFEGAQFVAYVGAIDQTFVKSD